MKFPESISLKTSVNGLEDAIIVISGPALAISGIIAGVDLLTGGHVLQQVTWLALAWAICLLLTLDFQVLALGARAHQVYLSEKSGGRKVLEIVLAFAIAAAISFVSIQMQSIIARVNGSGLTIDQAAAQLGVNTVALIWERSALVLVLIFMSGWFREEKHERGEQAANSANTPTIIPASSATDEAIKQLAEQMALLAVSVTQITTTVTEVKTTVTAIVEGDQGEQSAVDALQLAAPALAAESDEQAPASDAEKALANGNARVDKESEQPLLLTRFQSKEQAIAAILQRTPGASAEEVARDAECSVRTASKWIQRLQQTEGDDHENLRS